MSNYVRKTSNNKCGRPTKQIDQEIFENLCDIHCTKSEIADIFQCNEDTINAYCKRTYGENFSAIYKRLSATGKASLRRIQFKLAETNTSMAIWLGKQYLGQK